MSFSAVRPYFRDRFEALTFEEHRDGFNVDNIPQTEFDGIFHIGAEDALISNVPNQLDNAFEYPVTISLGVQGFTNVTDAVDASDTTIDEVLAECLGTANRLNTTGIKNVEISSITRRVLDESDDNAFFIEFTFLVKFNQCF